MGAEERPRSAVESNVPADTAMGFVNTFRFGHPFFLGPNVDETFWRAQIKDNISIVSGPHTVKLGGEWIHSVNSQIFRGFFQGRYIFDSTTGFLRYASPAAAGGFGPSTVGCSNGTFVTATREPARPEPRLRWSAPALSPGSRTIRPGHSPRPGFQYQERGLAFFAQDKWQIRPNFT